MSSKSWWSFGDSSGYDGAELALYRIECAFCGEQDNFELEKRHQRNSKAQNKALNYDIYKCNGCANLTMVFWSSGGRLHDYKQVPWPLKATRFPEYWPPDVGRYWMQAQNNLDGGNWDAAALMARSALQLLLRHEKAVGGSLMKEIDDLAGKGLIPPIVKDWSHGLRVLGNDAAHPQPGDKGVDEKDARHVVKFLRVLLTLLHDLPDEIKTFRGDKAKKK